MYTYKYCDIQNLPYSYVRGRSPSGSISIENFTHGESVIVGDIPLWLQCAIVGDIPHVWGSATGRYPSCVAKCHLGRYLYWVAKYHCGEISLFDGTLPLYEISLLGDKVPLWGDIPL